MRGGPHRAAGARFAVPLLFLALTLCGCGGRFDRFGLHLPDGGSIRIREAPAAPPDREGILELPGAGQASSLYRLGRPVSMESEGLALAVSYESTLVNARLTLFSGRNTVLREVTLPESPPLPTRYLVALERGQTLWGVRISSTEASSGRLSLRGMGIVPLVRGLALSADEITLDGSIRLAFASRDAVRGELSEQLREQIQGRPWRITMDLRGPSAVTFTGDAGQRALFAVDDGPVALEFYTGNIGFLPLSIQVAAPESTAPLSLGISVGEVSANGPIPADPGTILTYEKARWRRPDFEVFSWNRFPGVLIFDTASYQVQDRLFKRLAFYVEKAGFTGSIPEDFESLEGLLGYNAHDYRAEDLASFFTLAKRQARSLTAEEALLRSILVDAGVIIQMSSGFDAGEGSVLSISRSSSLILRELLLTHECFHGVFFSLASYREACTRAWDSLSEAEKEVWLAFLDSRGYDTVNRYLVVNEFQSYLLQQARQGVPGFQAVTLSRLRARSAREEALVRRLLAGSPRSFLASFDALEAALAAAGGPSGGKVISMEKAAE